MCTSFTLKSQCWILSHVQPRRLRTSLNLVEDKLKQTWRFIGPLRFSSTQFKLSALASRTCQSALVQAGHRKLWSCDMNPWKYVCRLMRDFSVVFWMWIGRIYRMESSRNSFMSLSPDNYLFTLLRLPWPIIEVASREGHSAQQHWFLREE